MPSIDADVKLREVVRCGMSETTLRRAELAQVDVSKSASRVRGGVIAVLTRSAQALGGREWQRVATGRIPSPRSRGGTALRGACQILEKLQPE